MKRVVFVAIIGFFFPLIQARHSFPSSSGPQECGQPWEDAASAWPYAATPLGGGARRPAAGHLHAPASAADDSDSIEGWSDDDEMPHRYGGAACSPGGEAVWDDALGGSSGAAGGAGAPDTVVRTAQRLPTPPAFRFSQSTASSLPPSAASPRADLLSQFQAVSGGGEVGPLGGAGGGSLPSPAESGEYPGTASTVCATPHLGAALAAAGALVLLALPADVTPYKLLPEELYEYAALQVRGELKAAMTPPSEYDYYFRDGADILEALNDHLRVLSTESTDLLQGRSLPDEVDDLHHALITGLFSALTQVAGRNKEMEIVCKPFARRVQRLYELSSGGGAFASLDAMKAAFDKPSARSIMDFKRALSKEQQKAYYAQVVLLAHQILAHARDAM